MKKITIPIILSLTLLLQACNSPVPLPLFSSDTDKIEKKIVDNLDNTSSYTLDTGVNIHFLGIKAYSNVKTEINQSNQMAYMNSETSVEFPEEAKDVVTNSSMTLNMESYSISENEKTDIYSSSKKTEGKWIYSSSDSNISQTDYSWISDLTVESNTIKVNDATCIKMTGAIAYSKFKTIVNQIGLSPLGIVGVGEEVSGDATVIFFVDTKTYLPVRLEISLEKADRDNSDEYNDEEIMDAQVYDALLDDFSLSYYIDYIGFGSATEKTQSIPEEVFKNVIGSN